MLISASLGLAITFAVIILGITLVSLVAPVVWKHGVLFGVTVALDTLEHPEGRALMRRWRVTLGSIGVALAAACVIAALALPLDLFGALVGPALMVVFIALNFVLYIVFHHQATAFALPAGSAIRAASLDTRPTAGLPLWWEILPLALIAATAIFLAPRYAAAPASIPIHWNATGTPNHYVPKSIGAYFVSVWLQLGLWLFLTIIVAVLRTQRLAARGLAAAAFIQVIGRMLYWTKTLVIVLLGALAVLTVAAPAARLATGIPFFVVIFMVALFAVIAANLRAYGAKLQGAPSEVTGDGTPDQYWIGGLIYHNPHDPALFVPRRIGIGVTLNFGHPASWFVLLGLLAIPITAVVLSIIARH